jgi:hypothetical protein
LSAIVRRQPDEGGRTSANLVESLGEGGSHPFAAPGVLSAQDLNRDHNFSKMRAALHKPESVRRFREGKDSIDHRLEPVL